MRRLLVRFAVVLGVIGLGFAAMAPDAHALTRGGVKKWTEDQLQNLERRVEARVASYRDAANQIISRPLPPRA